MRAYSAYISQEGLRYGWISQMLTNRGTAKLAPQMAKSQKKWMNKSNEDYFEVKTITG